MTGVLFAAILAIQGAEAFTIVHTNTYAIAVCQDEKLAVLTTQVSFMLRNLHCNSKLNRPRKIDWRSQISPLNTKLWLHELAGDEDEAFLADGIINGFQLVDCNTQLTEVNMRNYKSATSTFKLLVEKTIRNSARQLRYYGYKTYGGKRFRSDS